MTSLFDTIIISFLLLDGVLVAIFIKKWFRQREKFPWLFKAVGFLLSLGWFLVFYGSFIEPHIIIIREQRIQLNKNPTQIIRAALISDFHIGPYKGKNFVERVTNKINTRKPDIVFITGDFVFDSEGREKFLEPLKNLAPPLGIFAVLGNHDYADSKYFIHEEGEHRALAVKNMLESLGIKVFLNQGQKIDTEKGGFFLLGVDEIWTGRASVEKALNSIESSLAPEPNILLAHNPDIILEAKKYNIDLVLAGHTHGGQFWLPFVGPMTIIPTKLGNTYDRGLFQFGNTQLFITSGLGETGPGPRSRLFVPPEIVLLEIDL